MKIHDAKPLPARARTRATSSIELRKRASQSRSRETIAVILEAAARVLAAESLAGFNTNRVAEVAGVSIGSLYQYFPNKAALSAALIERSQSALVAAVEAVASKPQATLCEQVRALVRAGIRHQFDNASLAAALDYEELHLPVSESLAFANQRLVRLTQAILSAHADTMQAPASTQTARDCLLIVKSLIDADALSSGAAKPSRSLASRVERAIMGYLLYQPQVHRALGG
jgi:AcrR family transcriptional regulator